MIAITKVLDESFIPEAVRVLGEGGDQAHTIVGHYGIVLLCLHESNIRLFYPQHMGRLS